LKKDTPDVRKHEHIFLHVRWSSIAATISIGYVITSLVAICGMFMAILEHWFIPVLLSLTNLEGKPFFSSGSGFEIIALIWLGIISILWIFGGIILFGWLKATYKIEEEAR
jgi:hypothetical protein